MAFTQHLFRIVCRHFTIIVARIILQVYAESHDDGK